MRCLLSVVAVTLFVVQNVNAQFPNYGRMYFPNQRPVAIYPSGSGVVRSYIPLSSGRDDLVRPKGEDGIAQKVRLDVYYATDCPDSMRFIVRQLYPLYQEMEDVLDIHLVPYGKASETYNADLQKHEFRCQHGPSECYGNTVHSCAMSLYPEKKDYMNFINCMMSYPRPSHNGQKCARRTSLDWEKIDKCAKGEEGNRLLHEMAQLTESINPRLYFIPWIVVDKVFSEKKQRRALRNLKSVVCDSYKGSHPKCSQ